MKLEEREKKIPGSSKDQFEPAAEVLLNSTQTLLSLVHLDKPLLLPEL